MSTRTFVNLPTINLGYSATLLVSSPAALSSLLVSGPLTEGGYNSGQTAWCASTGQIFVLRTAVGIPDGKLVLSTPDDQTRQWAVQSIMGGQTNTRVVYTSPEVDLTQPQIVTLIPPINFKGMSTINPRIFVTQKNGTVNAPPTIQIGANSTINDVNVSSNTATLASQALNTVVILSGVVNPHNLLDFSQFGIRFQITAGAGLGSATSFKGRVNLEASIFQS